MIQDRRLCAADKAAAMEVQAVHPDLLSNESLRAIIDAHSNVGGQMLAGGVANGKDWREITTNYALVLYERGLLIARQDTGASWMVHEWWALAQVTRMSFIGRSLNIWINGKRRVYLTMFYDPGRPRAIVNAYQAAMRASSTT